MSWLFTSRHKLGMWLIQRGLHMLPNPCWVTGVIVIPMPSGQRHAVHTYEVAPVKEHLPALSGVNSAVSELLYGMASGKDCSIEVPGSGCHHDPLHASDGSPDAKSLH